MRTDLYTELLGIPPGVRPPSHYELLGLPMFESDPEKIHAAILSQSAKLKRWVLDPNRVRARAIQRMLNEVGQASADLEDAARKRDYDVSLGAPPPPLEDEVLFPEEAEVVFDEQWSVAAGPPPERSRARALIIAGVAFAAVGSVVAGIALMTGGGEGGSGERAGTVVVGDAGRDMEAGGGEDGSGEPAGTAVVGDVGRDTEPAVGEDGSGEPAGTPAVAVTTLPVNKAWTSEKRRVPVATPRGQEQKEITYYRNALGMEFVLIPAGEFMMGSPANEPRRSGDEGPRHRVRITKAFHMGATEVTQEHYERVMGKNPSGFKRARNPVEQVSWVDASEFCRRLSLTESAAYRLPTEAEWEYACRAGATGRYCVGDDEGRLRECAWQRGNSGGKAHPVGQKKPNALGLYDMHCNAWEWCADWHDSDYYSGSPAEDPQGPRSGTRRVLRGGSWNYAPHFGRSAYRYRSNPSLTRNSFGFRVVAKLPRQEVQPVGDIAVAEPPAAESKDGDTRGTEPPAVESADGDAPSTFSLPPFELPDAVPLKGTDADLLDALYDCDLEKVTALGKGTPQLLDGGFEEGATPLVVACLMPRKESVPVVRALLALGASPNTCTTRGWTPLYAAVGCENYGYARYMAASHGLDYRRLMPSSGPSRPSPRTMPRPEVPLAGEGVAAAKVAALLENGAGMATGGWSVSGRPIVPLLYHAASVAPGDAIAILARASTKEALSEHGPRLLVAAAAGGRMDTVELLLERGINGDEALRQAALRTQADLVEILIARGADVNATDIRGRTALHLAAGALVRPPRFSTPNVRPEVLELLLANGADVNAVDQEGKTPLDLARRGRGSTAAQAVSVLTDAGGRSGAGDVPAPADVLGHGEELLRLRQQVERLERTKERIAAIAARRAEGDPAALERYKGMEDRIDEDLRRLKQEIEALTNDAGDGSGAEAAPAPFDAAGPTGTEAAPAAGPDVTGAGDAHLPRAWASEKRRVRVATPQGQEDKEITYYRNTPGMEFVLVPAGEFMMGSPAAEAGRKSNEGPQHRVRITRAFYMGATEVTQKQYEKVMGTSPPGLKGAKNAVGRVSWSDTAVFCARLSRTDGATYRLPTEAEWEYACRAGSTGTCCFGDDAGRLGECAWHAGNSRRNVHPIAQKAPNAWGLYDMYGNVYEWCRDLYDSDYYGTSPATDPQGPRNAPVSAPRRRRTSSPAPPQPPGSRSSSLHVLRGGSLINTAGGMRSASRGPGPRSPAANIGFRVVVEAE